MNEKRCSTGTRKTSGSAVWILIAVVSTVRAAEPGPPPAPQSPVAPADVLQHFDPTFVRNNFVDIILKNSWPE